MLTDPVTAYLFGAAVALVAEHISRWLFER